MVFLIVCKGGNLATIVRDAFFLQTTIVRGTLPINHPLIGFNKGSQDLKVSLGVTLG